MAAASWIKEHWLMLPDILPISWANPGDPNPIQTATRRLRKRGQYGRSLGKAANETAQAGSDCLSWQRPAPPSLPNDSGKDPARFEIMFEPTPGYAADTMGTLWWGRQG